MISSNFKNKAISPIIAILILIALTIAISSLGYTFVFSQIDTQTDSTSIDRQFEKHDEYTTISNKIPRQQSMQITDSVQKIVKINS